MNIKYGALLPLLYICPLLSVLTEKDLFITVTLLKDIVDGYIVEVKTRDANNDNLFKAAPNISGEINQVLDEFFKPSVDNVFRYKQNHNYETAINGVPTSPSGALHTIRSYVYPLNSTREAIRAEFSRLRDHIEKELLKILPPKLAPIFPHQAQGRLPQQPQGQNVTVVTVNVSPQAQPEPPLLPSSSSKIWQYEVNINNNSPHSAGARALYARIQQFGNTIGLISPKVDSWENFKKWTKRGIGAASLTLLGYTAWQYRRSFPSLQQLGESIEKQGKYIQNFSKK